MTIVYGPWAQRLRAANRRDIIRAKGAPEKMDACNISSGPAHEFEQSCAKVLEVLRKKQEAGEVHRSFNGVPHLEQAIFAAQNTLHLLYTLRDKREDLDDEE